MNKKCVYQVGNNKKSYRWSVKVLVPQTYIILIPMYNYFNNTILKGKQ